MPNAELSSVAERSPLECIVVRLSIMQKNKRNTFIFVDNKRNAFIIFSK